VEDQEFTLEDKTLKAGGSCLTCLY